MRISALFLRVIVFAAAGALAFVSAQSLVQQVEERSVEAVQETLVDQGYTWANVLGDGLQVILEGDAPTEALRFRAMSAAGTMVDASRVIDNLTVLDSEQIAPPEFSIEILRNDAGVSLIGLIPASTDREALAARITDIADGGTVTDLLEVGNYPAPQNWRVALNYALRALETLNKSKISVNAERVIVDAIADSIEERRRLETALARNTPEGVRLAIDIRAPRPVISPFTTRFIVDEDGARFDACAVDTPEALDAIMEAASAAGFQNRAPCVFALGAPSRQWGEAVALSIDTLRRVGGGTVTISDTDVTLVAREGADQGGFDNAVGRLENDLPDAFALRAELPVAQEADGDETPSFTATLSPEGMVQLRGRIPDDVTNTVVENFAQAKFGQDNITMGTRLTEGLPSNWSVRVLAGVEALSALSNGVVSVEPTSFSVRGNTGNPDASAEVARLLIQKLGQAADFDIDITYVEELDPIASLPTPEECIGRINAVKDANKILFDPGSAQLTAATQPVVDAIAEILRECGDLPIRVSGYTDSQGREEMNQQLSQARADAVLTALRARRVPVGTFESVGFGEQDPIASNDTEEGREANRRIEFSLITEVEDGEETSETETDTEAESD
ncbi:OmpA family protein [Yoonia litorea]|uniref:OmpA-OmpF porin, OOP family n=1 Tax=Yoonia litorea TaxID=1123755 RepID=A0A1I6L2W1_9RHOB|nr:OmpA family protein [Yoonia litorea]SFR97781.1 OmpA-OmpF porin, OOP family [Yoonia litorea]